MKLRKIGIAVIASALVCAFLLCSCSGSATTQSASNNIDYADDEAMTIIASGLEARWAITDSSTYEDTSENLKKAINAELEKDSGLRDRQFEDSDMQEDVLAYLNILEDSIEVLDNCQYESNEYYEKWWDVYDQRTSQIKTLVDDYGLTVSESNQGTLDDLIANGTAVKNNAERDDAINKLFEKAEFEKTDDGYGFYEYTATIKNSTDFDFEDVSIVLALYDEEGVKAGETYASTNSWEKGEKVRFEGGSDINAEKVKASVEYYSVKE